MKKITIADYGIGNLLSVKRAFNSCGAEVKLASNPEEIMSADRLVVPGVGAFKKCMQALESHELKESLIEVAKKGNPYLGICVGMQMLMDKSYEFGETDGLAIINGDVKKIELEKHTIPVIGWKETVLNNKSDKYYFIHSYQAKPKKQDNILSTYKLGEQEIVASVIKDNVIGVQFHPEKSGEVGIKFLNQFLNS